MGSTPNGWSVQQLFIKFTTSIDQVGRTSHSLESIQTSYVEPPGSPPFPPPRPVRSSCQNLTKGSRFFQISSCPKRMYQLEEEAEYKSNAFKHLTYFNRSSTKQITVLQYITMINCYFLIRTVYSFCLLWRGKRGEEAPQLISTLSVPSCGLELYCGLTRFQLTCQTRRHPGEPRGRKSAIPAPDLPYPWQQLPSVPAQRQRKRETSEWTNG